MANRTIRALIICFCILMQYVTNAQTDTLEIILIGDGGELTRNQHPVLNALRNDRTTANGKAAVLFYLGDNLYPTGLPQPDEPNFSKKAAILDTQWTAGLKLAKQVYFIPGNHDWAKGRDYGWQQIQNQASYLEELNNPAVHMLPEDGCPGPEEIQISENVTAIVMDSQWWLQQEQRPGSMSDCPCKTEGEVLNRLEEMLYRNRDKTVLYLAHHPFLSSGIHGGYYTFKQHLFPLTDWRPNLYVPLPIVGSLYPLLRGGLGNIQDIRHPVYQKMAQSIDSILNKHPFCIRIAGHEHGLQYINRQNQHYLVSGAGSKQTRHRPNTPAHQSFSTTGYARLLIPAQGSPRLELMEANTNGLRQLLSVTLEKPTSTSGDSISEYTAFQQPLTDSVTSSASALFRANGFKKWLLGGNYRAEWGTPIKAPVLHISNPSNPLRPTQRGGGMQSRSLRLEDSSGREFVIRSIEKYPDKTLPEELRQTFVKDAIADGISASYPFAALSVAVLAKVAGVPYLEPELVYLPNDTALGPFRSSYADHLYLFEPREPAGVSKTLSTPKLLQQLEKNNDNRVDQLAVLNARMLDLFIMDFDRHDDQWRWAVVKKKEGNRYYPIPRDRDQAFFISTGVIPYLISRPWLLPKFQGFDTHAENINRFNFNARYFDRSFLNKTSRQDWQQAANNLVLLMTDSAIDAAMRAQPAAIQAQAAPKIAAILKARRTVILKEALHYQAFLHKTLDIPGSDNKDWFRLETQSDGKLRLTIYDINKQGIPSDKLSTQEIDPGITRELRLYGLKGADVFELKGSIPRKFRVRIIGGGGADSVIANHQTPRSTAVRWYDKPSESYKISGTGLIRKQFSDKPGNNRYNRNAFRYNITAPLLTGGFNLDDGIFIGAGVLSTVHGFRKDPYAYQHQFLGSYAAATGAYQFRYRFDAPWVRFQTQLHAPNNTRNFFGFGNETEFDKSDDKKIRYYRSRFSLFDLAALAKWKPAKQLELLAGPVLQHYWIDYDDNEGRFITQPESGLDQFTLQQKKTFLGLQLQADLDTRNNRILPTRGVHWTSSARLVRGLNAHSSNFTQWESALAYYIGVGHSSSWVLAGRTGGGANYGRYEFFQAQTLGGNSSLRGYRNFRFAGDHRFFNNLDLRIKLTEIRGYLLPGTLGILLFQDIGRVWLRQKTSSKWHLGYGGGLWLAPANRIVVAACYGQSDEGGLPFVSVGFQF